jgi:kynureninase
MLTPPAAGFLDTLPSMSTPPVATADPLLGYRRHFPQLESCTYLISNSLGAMPRGAEEGLEEYARSWKERGVRAWADSWWALAGTVGDGIGRVVGAPAGTVSMHQNVTTAEAIVLSCFDWKPPRNRLVGVTMNFPTNRYLHDRFAPRLGAEVVEVPSPDGLGVPLDALLAAIDERTRLVSISHVLFQTAFVQEAEAVCRRAREVGAHVLLDCFQSAGTLPLDVTRLACAFATGGVLKWLCGGPGGAWLYVRPDLLDTLEPRLTGWVAHEMPFDFAPPPMRYAKGAYRFMTGTPNVPALYAAMAGPALIAQAGAERIRQKSLRQTQRLIDGALAEGWTVNAPLDPARRGGTVAIDCPHAHEVKLELLEREVIVDFRPGAGIRVAPHFYTKDEECDRALHEMRSILATGAWKRHAGRRTHVT